MPSETSALKWTAQDVLVEARRKAALPKTSTEYTDQVVLREATDVLWSFGGWAMSQFGEGRLVEHLDRLSTELLASPTRTLSEVALPALAVGDAVDAVSYVDSTGAGHYRLIRIDPAQESDYARPDSEGLPKAYALLSGRIRLYPRPTEGGTVRVQYQRRQGELIVDTPGIDTVVPPIDPILRSATLVGHSGTSTSTTLTLSVAITDLLPGDRIDLIAPSVPHQVLVSALELTSVADTVLETSTPYDLLTNLDAWGQPYVCRTGHSPVVSLPLEMRGAFTEKVAAHLMRQLGDLQGAQASEQAALMEMSRVLQLLSPRARRDKPRAVNAYSHLRLRMGRR